MTKNDDSLPALPEQEFLTVKQTAEFLNVSASLIYKLCVEQKLDHYRFGDGDSAIRIDRSGLMEFVKRRHLKKDEAPQQDENAPRRGKRTPYVYQFLGGKPRRMRQCGATTKAGTPCNRLTEEDRCHLHRGKSERLVEQEDDQFL
jgi:excisionase family DNA binding protein